MRQLERHGAAVGLASAVRPSVSVSACLIVRNEEKFLEGCLRSLIGRVEEIIVVDTGSTDRTLEILRRYGIDALRYNWTGDFAAARNVGLDAANGSWILYIDADERLNLPAGGALRDYIDASAIACNVRFRPKTGFTRYLEPRLFRSDPRLRFQGRIHETISPKIRGLVASQGFIVANSRVEIDHLGYDGDQSHKHARNVDLLRTEIKAQPDRVYCWYHLSETLACMGRKEEAVAAAEAGLMAVRRDTEGLQRAEASLLLQTLVRLRLEAGQDAFALINEGLSHDPEDYGLLFQQGQAFLRAARYSDAIAIAERLRAVDLSALEPSRLAFDEAIFGISSCELAAVACLRSGRLAEAGHWYRLAALLSPDDRAARIRAAAFDPPDKGIA